MEARMTNFGPRPIAILATDVYSMVSFLEQMETPQIQVPRSGCYSGNKLKRMSGLLSQPSHLISFESSRRLPFTATTTMTHR